MVDVERSGPVVGPLPVRLTRFFGREAEIAELLDVVDRTRLVTLVGAAGCGKTRLVIEVGERLAGRFPGGVWFVDLAPIGDGESVAGAMAGVLGVREEPGRVMDDTLVEDLAGVAEPLLVVLDNCEQVIDAVASMVERLVGTCLSVQVVATSRVGLGLSGEQVWDVVPLSVEPAAELFVDRARLASSRFRLEESERATVVKICERLGGLPLAIELAAASTRLMSVRQIADRLVRALPLLTGGRRVTSQRHATMEAAVDWSLRLLPSAEQALFERLSVFAGGFDLEAAVAVAGSDDSDDVASRLVTLVDHSLVMAEAPVDDAMRYRLLEPLRQCAAVGLAASGNGDRVRWRHAEHYLVLASQFDPLGTRGARPGVSFTRVEQEAGNLLAALRWACTQSSDLALRMCDALGPFWEFGGRVNEGRAFFEQTLAIDTPEGRRRVGALGWAARLAWRQGDYERARAFDEERLDLAGRIEDARGCAAALCSLGLIAFSRGDPNSAEEHCAQSISLAQRIGEEAIVVWALITWGWTRFSAGDLPGGEEKLRQALEANRGIGTPSAVAQALLGLQFGALLSGDIAAQRAHLIGALAALQEGAAVEPSDWLGCCSTLALVEGRSRAALRLFGAAVAFNQRRGTEHPNGALAATAERFEVIRSKLGPAVADRLLAEGAQMSWHELVAEGLAEPPGDDNHPLTSREFEIAGLVAEGLTNPEIARRLTISQRTVESHVEHIRRKLGFRNRQEVVIWALRESPRHR